MDPILRKKVKSSLAGIVATFSEDRLFDSHTVIEAFEKNVLTQQVYRDFCETFGVTFADRTKLKRAHSDLSKMIETLPGVERHMNGGKQWDAVSHNIYGDLNANKVWEFENKELFNEFLKKLQSEQ